MNISHERDIMTTVTIEATPDEYMEMLRWLYEPEYVTTSMTHTSVPLKWPDDPKNSLHPYNRLVKALLEASRGVR